MGSQKTKKLGKMKIVEAWFMQLQRTRTPIRKQGGLFVYVRARTCAFVCNQGFDYILHVSRRVEFEELICLDKGVPRHDSFVNCYRDQHR